MLRPHSGFWLLLAKVSCLFLVLFSFSTSRGDEASADGQKFTVHTVTDQTLGIPFIDLKAPAGWEVAGRVYWNATNVANPVTAGTLVINPDKSQAITFFPGLACFWLQGDAARNRPGTRSLGGLNLQPMSPENALRAAVLRKYRVKQPGAQVADVRSLPDLPAMLHLEPKNTKGIGLKLLYTENGVPTEEEFYALYYAHSALYNGPLGQIVEIDWGLIHVYSFKAPVGTLAKQRSTFNYVVQSVKVNPAWDKRKAEICASLAAKNMSKIDAENRRSIGIINGANRTGSNSGRIASTAGERTESTGEAIDPNVPDAADSFDMGVIRNEEKVNDPNTGNTTTRSNLTRYHWITALGDYQDTDDPNFNPNIGSSVTWTRMPVVE